ncbi:MAG: extracellular solute-binding protein [Clostridiales bacterium]|nr:extracellular solute-binding protein [Clostridiales bacterium]
MKNLPIRVMSAAMVASLMLSVAACNKGSGASSGEGGLGGLLGGGSGSTSGVAVTNESRSGAKISADSPWFDVKEIKISTKANPSKPVEYSTQRFGGIDKDKMLIITSGMYNMDNVTDAMLSDPNFNYGDYTFSYIDVVDRATGESINTIDLSSVISGEDYLDSADLSDGKIICHVTSFDMNTYESFSKTIEIDAATGSVLDSHKDGDSSASFENTFEVGDYVIQTEFDWSEANSSYNLHISSPDGSKNVVKLGDGKCSIYDIRLILGIDENTALVPATSDEGWKYFELDLKSGTSKEVDGKAYEWLSMDDVYYSYNNDAGETFFTSGTGVCKINMKDKVIEKILDFSWCDINRNKLAYLEIADITGDTLILSGENYNPDPYNTSYESDFVMYEFTKAATNPHAGKTVLELYQNWGYTQDKIGDAIVKFNQTNSEYFIEVTDRYKEDSGLSMFDSVKNDDDYTNAELNMQQKLSNQLAMDILNGEGPDILMNVGEYGQLNSTNYLVDLTTYVGELDSNKYFTNIIDASKVDGKLYNLPICYGIDGIQTDTKYAGASGVGFTTEEYEKFLKETLNGKDVLSMGQATYFAKLFNTMSDKFIVNGKADFSGPEFAALAEYVKNNVSPNATNWDDMYNDDEYSYGPVAGVGATVFKGDSYYADQYDAVYTTCYGMSYYLTTMVQTKGGTGIYGLPSADGRGPAVESYLSVAVSAQSVNADACGEFVKMLMSDDVQLNFAMNDNLVLSREAFRQGAQKAVEYYNGDGYDYYFGSETKNRFTFTEAHIDSMENIISSCSRINSADADINIILIEEMPAYFSGQKDLDSVIAIAQDRIQKVLGERG